MGGGLCSPSTPAKTLLTGALWGEQRRNLPGKSPARCPLDRKQVTRRLRQPAVQPLLLVSAQHCGASQATPHPPRPAPSVTPSPQPPGQRRSVEAAATFLQTQTQLEPRGGGSGPLPAWPPHRRPRPGQPRAAPQAAQRRVTAARPGPHWGTSGRPGGRRGPNCGARLVSVALQGRAHCPAAGPPLLPGLQPTRGPAPPKPDRTAAMKHQFLTGPESRRLKHILGAEEGSGCWSQGCLGKSRRAPRLSVPGRLVNPELWQDRAGRAGRPTKQLCTGRRRKGNSNS